jgi:cystathionine beta-lyase
VAEDKKRGTSTRLIHPLRRASHEFESLSTPVYRGSTTLFGSLAEVGEDRRNEDQYRYGLHGTPTTRELAARIGELEGAAAVQIVPSGLAAIALAYLTVCKSGDHVLVPTTAYGPNNWVGRYLRRFDVEVERYEPTIGSGIAGLLRDNTALVWCENPGSITMEVQDVPAIAQAAHDRGALVALDNTYAAGVLFDAFGHGADIAVQALTKYPAGHADLLMGSASARDPALADRLADTRHLLGLGVSPEDCALVLRGLMTFPLRLKHVESAALDIAQWLGGRPEVDRVLHPAMPGCTGHDIWRRDFTGSSGIFSFIVKDWEWRQVEAFMDRLELFKIGYSWGGPVSLALAYPDLLRPTPEEGPRLIRLNIGLEDVDDLKADLGQAFTDAK